MTVVLQHIESIQIHRVSITDGLWGASTLFAKSLYPQGTQFHVQCDEKRALCGWVMTQNANIVGRIAAYVRHPSQLEEFQPFSGPIFLGNYECVNVAALSKELFDRVFSDLRELGFNRAIGPLTGTTWGDYRFKTAGTNAFLGEAQQLGYYVNQWHSSGFTVCENYHSTEITQLDGVNEKIQRLEREYVEGGMVFRQANLLDWENELKLIFGLSLTSFADNVLYEPIDWDEFRNKYLPLQSIADSRWITLVESKQGELVGFAFAIPNWLDPQGHGLVLKTVARSKHKLYRGLGLIMAQRLHLAAHAAGKKYVIHAYMHSGNASLACSNTLHGRICATYQLFEKTLCDS